MSFILDSIKKAERERKLGHEVPSISIEYSGEHVGTEHKNFQQWALMLLGLLVTAIIVWAATYHFTNLNRDITDLTSEALNANVVSTISEVETIKPGKQNIAMVPIKKVHQSDLKTIKVISEEDRIYEPRVEAVIEEEISKSVNVVETATPKNTNAVRKSEPLYQFKPIVVKENNKNEVKQEIAAIYSDLAKFSPKNEPVDEVVEQFIEIEPASYIAEEKTLPKNNVSHVTSKTAVSTGLPSFGELPYDVQEQIPDFSVSVHMFHTDPNQRRIRINGNMYTEGKKLQQDLALVEITRYGAVFDYQGHLFRYNVR